MVVEVEGYIAYCTDLDRNNIKEVLSLILKPAQKNTMTSTLFNITQNRFMMCSSPFSPKIETKIVQNCTALSTDTSVLVKRLAKERKVTILKKGGNIVMLNQAEEIAMAESKVKRNIITRKTKLRRVDSESLVKLLQNFNPTSRVVNSSSSAKNRRKVTGTSPREVQRDERTEVQLPFVNSAFINPSYPTQETGNDTDCLSMQMAINAPSMFSSRSETSLPSGFSYRSANASSSTAFSAPTTRSGQTKESNSFIATVPRYPEYTEAEKRFFTFKTPAWRHFEKPDQSLFVDLGFFFTGREDLVRCFTCGIGLKDWVKNDAVLQEHVKHSPECTYLLNKFGRLEVDRIQTGISSGDSTISSGSQLPYNIRSPQYQTMEARLASFKSFPGYIAIPHQQLAVAGLYFTGQGDLCRCFTCDGGLKDWSTGNDPCREHATYFPTCDYINQLKGRDYVKALHQARQKNHSVGAAGGAPQQMLEPEASTLLPMERLRISSSDHSRSTVSQITGMGYSKRDMETAKAELERKGDANPSVQSIVNTILDMQDQEKNITASVDDDPEDLRAIAEENERLSQIVQCMLCVEEEPDILFLPCAHHRICHKCSENITHCPVCNNYIEEKVRTYRHPQL